MAATLVVMHHFLLANRDSGQSQGFANFLHLSEFGACGVDLFFCISGFVMLHSIAKKARFSALDFAIGRFVRIVPLYWIASAVFIGIVAINHVHKLGLHATLLEPLFSPGFLTSSLFLIPAVNPDSGFVQPFLAQGWTLSYELYFYVLLMIAAFGKNVSPVRITVICSAFLAVGLITNMRSLALSTFFNNPIVIEFIFGMLVFLLTQRTKKFGLLAVGIGAVALIATIFIKPDSRLIYWGIPSALILYGFVASEGKIPVISLFKEIGNASYSLYLTHGILTYLYGGFVKRGWFNSAIQQNLAVLIGTLAAVALGILSYKFVEKPLVGWLNKRRSGAKRASATQEPHAVDEQLFASSWQEEPRGQ